MKALYVLSILFAPVIVWFVSAYVNLDLNLLLWNGHARVMYVMFTIILMVCLMILSAQYYANHKE